MTRYFEVLRRDGPARMGRLLLKRQISTPGIIIPQDYLSVGSVFGYGSLEEAIAAQESLKELKNEKSWPSCRMFPQHCTSSRPWSCQLWI